MTTQRGECNCNVELGVCCEEASLLIRRIRDQCLIALHSGDWSEFNQVRTQYEDHRLEAKRRLECGASKIKRG